MKNKYAIVFFLIFFLMGAGLAAAKITVFEFSESGFRFSWAKTVKMKSTFQNGETVYKGVYKNMELTVIARTGEKVPHSQTVYRLTNYFTGKWTQKMQQCPGKGITECKTWAFDAVTSDVKGIGMVGYGPGGTYTIIITSSRDNFYDLKPLMWTLENSFEFF